MARRPIKTSESEAEDDVNVTPLLDIVFIMLIFFIVTSTFIKEPGIDPTRPKVELQEAQKKVSILVAISADDEIYINNEQVDISELGFHIRELRKETPKGSAVVQADIESRSETLIQVLQEVKDAGIQDVAVSTEAI